MEYRERLLLFTNEAAVGIFNLEKSSIFIALSANGEFIKLFSGTSSTVHLTRFCPSNAHDFVKKLLLFRNKYSKQPYLCDRFHKSVSSVFVNSKTVHWERNLEHSHTNSSGWKFFHHSQDQNAFAICPYNKRLCYFSEAIYVQDAAIGVHRTSASIPEYLALKHITIIPLKLAPIFFQRNNSSPSADLYAFDNHGYEVSVPISIPTGASDSSSAYKYFNEIEHELNILKSILRYPTTLAFALKVEEIDGETFMCSDPGLSILNSISCEKDVFLSESITVETWISKKITNDKNKNKDENKDEEDFNKEYMNCLDHSGFGCNASGSILSLKGDYFTFFSSGSGMYSPKSASQHPIVMHISLLDSLNSGTKNDSDVRISCDNAESEVTNQNMEDNIMRNKNMSESHIGTPLQVYRNAAIRLLAYREHLLDRERSLRMCCWVPYCLRVITRITPKNVLLSSMKLNEKNIPEKVNGDNEGPWVKDSREMYGTESDNRTCIDEDRIFSLNSDSNGFSGGNCTGQNQRSNDRGRDNGRERGRGRNENIRTTHQHNVTEIFNPVTFDNSSSSLFTGEDIIPLQLTTQFGTRFTAYPLVQSSKNIIENNKRFDNITEISENYGNRTTNTSSTYGYSDDEMDRSRSLINKNSGKYYKVRGVFSDRAQINICLKSQVRQNEVVCENLVLMSNFEHLTLIAYFPSCYFMSLISSNVLVLYLHLSFYLYFSSLFLFLVFGFPPLYHYLCSLYLFYHTSIF